MDAHLDPHRHHQRGLPRDTCQLICIDPAQTHEFWPHAAALIKAAMEKGRLSSYADVEHSVRNGSALLWLAWNGEKIKAAAVTELGAANGEKFCTIVACGGHERAQWLPLLAGLRGLWQDARLRRHAHLGPPRLAQAVAGLPHDPRAVGEGIGSTSSPAGLTTQVGFTRLAH
jgi:hypothetical protein